MSVSPVMIHCFEERGLGKAPFRGVGYHDAGSIRLGSSCDYCGTAIRHIYSVESSDKRRFKVGCECIWKTGDEGLKKFLTDEQKKQREGKRHAKWLKEQATREAELQAQRDRNGGKTDYEVEAERAQLERQLREEKVALANKWILPVMQQGYGDFCQSMAAQLTTQLATDFSDRCKSIMCDIYARKFGRRNSKAYETAYAQAHEKLFPDA